MTADAHISAVHNFKRRHRYYVPRMQGETSPSGVNGNKAGRTSWSPDRVTIIVRGIVYETLKDTLARFPDTLLGSEEHRACLLDSNMQALRLNRNRDAFEAVLFYYQSYGKLIKPPMITMDAFVQECEFYYIHRTVINDMKKREGHAVKSVYYEEHTSSLTLRQKAWQILEVPESSFLAKSVAIILSVLTILSVIVSCAMSLPRFSSSSQMDVYNDKWFLTELVLNVIFAFEYLLRLFFAPNKFKFMTSYLNLIDCIAIFPYFAILFLDARNLSKVAFVRAMRTARVLRLFRFSKHSETLLIVMKIISTCFNDMITLLLCLLVSCLFTGSCQYFVELEEEDTQFTSIPESMWWAIQTIVCLGYGDIVPKSVQGKISGSAVAIIGALTLTVPLLSIGGKYLSCYTKTFSISLGPDVVNATSAGPPGMSKLKNNMKPNDNENSFGN